MPNLNQLIALFHDAGLIVKHIQGDTNSNILHISNHSSHINNGTLFFAIKGTNIDGHQFIDDAIRIGATAIVHTDPISIPSNITAIQIDKPYLAYALACEWINDFPSRKMTLCGITGTNGKTTTAFLLHHLLKMGYPENKIGLLTTILYNDGINQKEAERTTPEATEIQTWFKTMYEHHCTHVVMENSSHGLDQYRTGLALFKTAIFTNLTGDHLDYHFTMDKYFESKKKLFTEFLHPQGTAIINIDDPWGMKLAEQLKQQNRKTIIFGTHESADWKIFNIKASLDSTRFSIQTQNEILSLSIPLIGKHNIFNLTGAIIAVNSLGLSLKNIQAIIQNQLPSIPGRLQSISLNNGAVVFIDYAHTDDALSNVLCALRDITQGKIRCLFGCGGNRDKTKRSRMGEIVTKLSDWVIITTDNPRYEDPELIIDQIMSGISPTNATPVLREVDRNTAIRQILLQSQSKDAILIAGKGHENYQEINGVKYPFNDITQVQEIAQQLGLLKM